MNSNSPINPKLVGRSVYSRTSPAAQQQPTAAPSDPIPKEDVKLGSGLKSSLSDKALSKHKFLSKHGFAAAGATGAGLIAASSLVAAGTLGMATAGLGALIGGAIGGAAGLALGDPKLAKKFVSLQKQEATQRTRNADGRFRTKSGTTQIATLRETYGEGFAAGLPGNMPLQVLRAATGTSLTQMVKNPDKVDKAKEKLSDWKAPELAPGGRTRNADGRIRQKRGDTKLSTLRKTYGLDFAQQLPGNLPLAILRASTGMSLSELVETKGRPQT